MGPIFNRISHWLGRTLSRPVHVHGTSRPTPSSVFAPYRSPALDAMGRELDTVFEAIGRDAVQ